MATLLENEHQLELQFLVRRYLVQFRYGCQNPNCTTKLCYSFRKKLTPTPARPSLLKARMMAYAIVESDDPYSRLCECLPQILPQDMNVQLRPVMLCMFPARADTRLAIFWDSAQHGTSDFAEAIHATGNDLKLECVLKGAPEALENYILSGTDKSSGESVLSDSLKVDSAVSKRFELPEDIIDCHSVGQYIFSSSNYTRFESKCGFDSLESLQNVLQTKDQFIVTQQTVARMKTPISWLRRFSGGLSSDALYVSRSLESLNSDTARAIVDLSVSNIKNAKLFRSGLSFFTHDLARKGMEDIPLELTTFKQVLVLRNSLRACMTSGQSWQRSWAQLDPATRKKVSKSLLHSLGNVYSLVRLFARSKGPDSFETHPIDAFDWRQIQPYLLFDTLSRSLDELLNSPSVDKQASYIPDNHAQIVIALCLTALVSFTHFTLEAPESRANRFWNMIHLLISERQFILPVQTEDPEAAEVLKHHKDQIYDVMDSLSDDRAIEFASKIVKVIAARQAFTELQNPNAQRSLHSGLFHELLLIRLNTIFGKPKSLMNPLHGGHILSAWTKNLVLRFWNGKPVLNRWEVGGASLEFLNSLKRCWGERSPSTFFDWLEKRISIEDIISFRDYEENPNTIHLISLHYLFSTHTSIMHFRTINYTELFTNYRTASFHTMFPEKILRDSDSRLFDMASLRLAVAQSPLLHLKVRRESLLEDAMNQLWKREPRELKRALKIDIDGESGVDQGGVSQEFFRLVFAEIFDPDSGLFTIDEESGMAWFRSKSVEPVSTFELVGILMGIGIHNGLILPVTFPRIFYKRLLGGDVSGLQSIRDGWPALYRSLRAIWTFEESPDGESFEDTFGLETVFTNLNHGIYEETDYIHGGERFMAAILKAEVVTVENFKPEPVSMENRINYINKQLEWLLEISVQREFEAFQRGFFAVMDKRTLSIVHAHVLKKIVEGSEQFDISLLEEKAQYVSASFGPKNKVVMWFWEVLKSYPPDLCKAFLKFMFGTDRIAAQSLKYINFTIEPYFSGEYPQPESSREALPTVSSCFGILRLPEYQSKDMLERKLTTALENCEGFGIA